MSEGDRAVARVFGVALMAVGGLIAVLSGGCTAVFVVGGLASPGDAGSLIPLALLFGGPVIAIGVAMVFGGRALFRGPSRKRPPEA